MKDGDLETERALFEAALGLPEETARRRFLDKTCGLDAELKRRILQLLDAEAEAKAFFDFDPLKFRHEPVAPAAINESSSANAAVEVDRYRIVRQLGQGGCGIVYLAEQYEPVRREVALKIIRKGMDTTRVMARFELERSALARMNHPNIARVYDAGSTGDGRPFFAMELVAGERITSFCDSARLPLNERIGLFIQVCYAVQHAHQKGIIHRDLKPSNILVQSQDGRPAPKIIDFGVAKAISDQAASDEAAMAEPFMGTPAYMSPEQAASGRQDQDTRSDVYSLGALLYELLLGRPPLVPPGRKPIDIDEFRRLLREQEPLPPSQAFQQLEFGQQAALAHGMHMSPRTYLHALNCDLDWVVLKALAKDRRQRFATVNELAMDLQRFLDNEALSSRPPKAAYRLGKFLRRHRVGFIASSAVLVALVGGLGTSTALFLREREAVRIQRQLRKEAEDAEKITRAVYQAREGNLEAANGLLAEVSQTPDRPSFEGVTVYRIVGDWLALQKRWKETAERFAVVERFGALDEWGRVTRDHQAYGVALIAANDSVGYDRFRVEHARRFSGVSNGDAVGRVLKICLLHPPAGEVARLIQPLGDRVDAWYTALPPELAKSWATIPVALWRYRKSDFKGTAFAASRGFDRSDHASACVATQRLLLAMCAFRDGDLATGTALREVARRDIETVFSSDLPPGDLINGFWYDWLFAKILLAEADGLGQPKT